MHNLALYIKMAFVTQNYSTAIYWYEKAAEKGKASAMNNLGFMYQKAW